MEKRELTCIGCPMGCSISVMMEGKEIKDISGYTCKRGREYAAKEVSAPTRILTTTVRVKNGMLPVVSVKTRKDIPKEKIFECMRALQHVQVEAPVEIGTVILENVAETGVDVIATKRV